MTERHRRAGRAIVRSGDGRVLMIRGEDPDDLARGGFWFTPGGGLDDGETVEDGIRRELFEETGLEVETLGPVVLRRRDRFPLLGDVWVQEETIRLVDVETAFEPDTSGQETLESSVITELRWMSTADLRALGEDYYPVCLADLLDEIDTVGPPSEPWFEDLTYRSATGSDDAV